MNLNPRRTCWQPVPTAKFKEAEKTGISLPQFKTLFYRYGTNLDILAHKAGEFYEESGNLYEAWLRAEVWYTIHYEMVTGLCDFFIRRTGMIHFEIGAIRTAQALVADTMADLLGWDVEKKSQQLQALEQAVKHATEFPSP